MTQAITLRLITRQATGGEIVRTRRIEYGEAMIGRAPGCDICLPDLAVDPQHALIKAMGHGRASIESLTGVPFTIGGKPALRVELDAARGDVVTFGTYDLLLGLDEDDDIAVTVTKQEEAYHPSPSLFSLKASLFGRRRMAWTLGLAILALCLILPIAGATWFRHMQIHPDRQWSTGPLSKAHAFLEKDCQSCHQAKFVAVRDEACLTCHTANTPSGETLRLNADLNRRGSPFIPRLVSDHAIHGRLLRAVPPAPTIQGKVKNAFGQIFNHPSDRCASCHLEHTGPPGKPVEADRPLKPTLVVANSCAGCHAQLKMRLPDTTLVDTPDWSHHPDFRPLVTVSADGPTPKIERIALSADPREHSGLIFSHRQHLDLTGGVARMGVDLGAAKGYGGALTCISCHRPTPGGASYQPIKMERDCAACHSLAFASAGGEVKLLPHGDVAKVMQTLQSFYGRVAAGSGEIPRRLPGDFRPRTAVSGSPAGASGAGAFRQAFLPGGACYDCHRISWDGDGPLGVKVAKVHLTARFMPRGAFDHSVPAHRGEGLGAFACVDCHKAAASDHSDDLLMPGVAKCATCHGKTEHQTPAAASGECGDCHSYHQPGKSTPTGQSRTFEAIFGPANSGPARGMPGA